MKKILLSVAFATLVGALVFGAAASLTVTSNDLGSGSADVESCDADGVNVSYGIDPADGTLVDTVTVSGVDDVNCDGQSIAVVVLDGGGAVLQTPTPATASVGTTSYDFSLSPSVSAAAIEEVTVTIAG